MVFPAISIINFVVLFYLGAKLSTLPLKNRSTKTFSCFFFTVSALALIEFLIYKSRSFGEAICWAHFASCWPLVFAFYLHFVTTLTDLSKRVYTLIIVINYITAPIIAGLFVLYVRDYKPLYFAGGYALESPVLYRFPYLLIGLWNTLLLASSFLFMIVVLSKKPKGTPRYEQASWILTAMTVYLVISIVSSVLIRVFEFSMPEPVTLAYLVFGILIFAGLNRGTVFYLESDKTAKSLIESKKEMVVITDTEDRILLINGAFREMFGIGIIELGDMVFTDFLKKKVTKIDSRDVEWDELPPVFSDIVVKTGGESSEKFIRLSRTAVTRRTGKLFGSIYTGVEITRLKQVQRDLEALLEEKEVLLNEIYHRVKNNMQIMISLFDLKVETINDPEVNRHITDFRQLIMTLNQIQQKIYESPHISAIEPDPFFREICLEVYNSYKPHIGPIQFSFSLAEDPIPGNTALIIGLLTGELLSLLLKEYSSVSSEAQAAVWFSSSDGQYTLRLELTTPEPTTFISNERKNSAAAAQDQFISVLIDMIDGTLVSETENAVFYEVHFPNTFVLRTGNG